MGEVYRAKDTRLGRDVAVKILPKEMSADAVRKQRLTEIQYGPLTAATVLRLVSSQTTIVISRRAVSTDILHFRARVLAVYGQGMFMGNL